MSLGIGMAAAYASQRLSSLLAQFSPAQTAPSDPASMASTTAAMAPATDASAATTATDTSLTGPTQPSLSGQILMTLMQMQSASGSATQSVDPLQNLFTAMDANGDGSISQGEMESYLENAGATQGQADSLYASLNPNGAGGISESQLGSALPTQGEVGGAHHHHHHHHGTQDAQNSSTNPVDVLMQAIDSNGDGAISQDEMTSFVTGNGGSAAQAQSDFTALAGTNGATVNSADLSKAWEALQQSQGTNWGGPIMLSMLNAFAGSTTATSSTLATA